MNQSLEALAEAALGFANELRGVHGKEPVDALIPGDRGSCCGCPVAATAGGWSTGRAGWEVGAQAVYVGPRGAVKAVYGATPPSVLEFMAAFDTGMFPQLDAVAVAAP